MCARFVPIRTHYFACTSHVNVLMVPTQRSMFCAQSQIKCSTHKGKLCASHLLILRAMHYWNMQACIQQSNQFKWQKIVLKVHSNSEWRTITDIQKKEVKEMLLTDDYTTSWYMHETMHDWTVIKCMLVRDLQAWQIKKKMTKYHKSKKSHVPVWPVP